MRGFREISNPERRIESMEQRIERLAQEKIYQLKNHIGDEIDNLPDYVGEIDGLNVRVYMKGMQEIEIVDIINEDGSRDYLTMKEYLRTKTAKKLNKYLDELLK